MIFGTTSGSFQAQADDGEWLRWLEANASSLQATSLSPPSGDLMGLLMIEKVGDESVSAGLFRWSRSLLSSSEGFLGLVLEDVGDFRSAPRLVAGPTTEAILKDAFALAPREADPGPVAALVVAELGLQAFLPTLLRLVLSPSPIMAATAKAAALRLGASLREAGSFDEVAPFLTAEAVADLKAWVETARE